MTKKNPLQTQQLKQNISSLEGEMKSLNDHLQLNPEDLFPDDDLLPGLNDVEIFDYDKEIKEIQIDCEETLECLSSLYLNVEEIEKKNISNIIKNDALALADLKFSLSCSKRGLINLMKQLDMGINDPLMYQAVGNFQKEIRDSVKMLYDIQKKMKDFYKDIRNELTEINTGAEKEGEGEELTDLYGQETYHIVDMDKLNEDIEKFMNKD
ncbi:MAG: hypothetical protein ACOC3Z_01190 [Nanoarchaeota archaeon]